MGEGPEKGVPRPCRALEASRRQLDVTRSIVGSPLGDFQQDRGQTLSLAALSICVENARYRGGRRGRGKTVARRSDRGFDRVGAVAVEMMNSLPILEFKCMNSWKD